VHRRRSDSVRRRRRVGSGGAQVISRATCRRSTRRRSQGHRQGLSGPSVVIDSPTETTRSSPTAAGGPMSYVTPPARAEPSAWTATPSLRSRSRGPSRPRTWAWSRRHQGRTHATRSLPRAYGPSVNPLRDSRRRLRPRCNRLRDFRSPITKMP
jgi:hypothetical protein